MAKGLQPAKSGSRKGGRKAFEHYGQNEKKELWEKIIRASKIPVINLGRWRLD